MTPSTIGADALAELSDDDILVVDHKAIAQFNPAGGLQSTVTRGTIALSSPAAVFLSDGHYFDAVAVSLFRHATDAEMFEFNPTGSADSLSRQEKSEVYPQVDTRNHNSVDKRGYALTSPNV